MKRRDICKIYIDSIRNRMIDEKNLSGLKELTKLHCPKSQLADDVESLGLLRGDVVELLGRMSGLCATMDLQTDLESFEAILNTVCLYDFQKSLDDILDLNSSVISRGTDLALGIAAKSPAPVKKGRDRW